MSLRYEFVVVVKNDERERVLKFVEQHGEMPTGSDRMVTLYFEQDEVILKFLKTYPRKSIFSFRPNIKGFLTDDGRIKIDSIDLWERQAPADHRYTVFTFAAPTNSVSAVFFQSPAVLRWFRELGKQVKAEMIFADFEDRGCKIFQWRSRNIHIGFDNDEYFCESRAEFIEIMSFFASSINFIEEDTQDQS